jgi:peptide/nickel transport system ATP-binding protein
MGILGEQTINDVVLQIDNLGISYQVRAGEIPAVPDFSLTIRRGESVGLVGESGCGKTTVAMGIMRYLGRNGHIVRGQIKLEGRDMATLSPSELQSIRGSKIAMVYQEPMSALNPCMTVGRQLIEILTTHGKVSRKEAFGRAVDMLKNVNMSDTETLMSRYPHQLSGGQQQRVLIAMAFISNPSLLLLDEPTTALDVTVEASVIDLIAQLREKYNTSLLYISHNLGVIAKVCDRVCVMYAGEVVEEGAINEVFNHTKHPYSVGLLDCLPSLDADKHSRPLVPIPGQVSLPSERPPGCAFGPRCNHFKPGLCDGDALPIETTEDNGTHWVRCLRWNEIVRDFQPPVSNSSCSSSEHEQRPKPVLQVEKLSKHYELSNSSLMAMLSRKSKRQIRANDEVTLSALSGHTLGLVGESGCGKSTFAKVLTGLEVATGGKIEFQGENIALVPVTKRAPSLIAALQMVFQNPDGTLNPSHSVGWAIGRAIKKLRTTNTRATVGEEVSKLLELVRLPAEFATRKPRQLSGGQKQRIALARAFAGNPVMIVADEPVSALDVSVQAAIINLFLEVQKKENTTLIFISHDLSVVRYLADSIVVMYLGQIVENGSSEEIFQPPYHPYTEALLSAVSIADTNFQQIRIRLKSEMPSVFSSPKGCGFSTRCHRRIGNLCDTTPPPIQLIGVDHQIRCHIPVEQLRKIKPVIQIALR